MRKAQKVKQATSDTRVLSVRLSVSEYEKFEKLAAERGVPVSRIASDILMKRPLPRADEDRALQLERLRCLHELKHLSGSVDWLDLDRRARLLKIFDTVYEDFFGVTKLSGPETPDGR